MFTLPLIVIVDPLAVKSPRAAMVSPPAVTARFNPDVVRMVAPVAPPVELLIVRVPPSRSGFVAIV
jgi:hypothetical protein